MSEGYDPDNYDYTRLNKNLRKKFSTGMPFFRSSSFRLESDWDDALDNCKKLLIHFLGHIQTLIFLAVECADKEVQTETCNAGPDAEDLLAKSISSIQITRPLEECLKVYQSELGASALTDEEVIILVKNRHIATYQVEKAVDNPERGVGIRRKILGENGNMAQALVDLPYKNYDYSKVSHNLIWDDNKALAYKPFMQCISKL